LYTDIFIFIIGLILIIKSADIFTAGAEGVARAFKIPRIIIGVTIVSLATTAPEFTVSSISSYMNLGGIAVGNALGSCLANIALILAVAVIIRPIKLSPEVLRRELPFLIFVILTLYLLAVDNRLARVEGMFLCLLLVAFFAFIVLKEIKKRKKVKEKEPIEYNIWKDSLKFLIGTAGVILSAKYAIVPSGVKIAHLLGVPDVVIGLTMIAVGTSLPELFTAIVASVKNMGELAIGNVIGANILNILWVLGGASWIRALDVDMETKMMTIPVVFFITILMFLFSRTKFTITRKEGLVLFIIYSGYIFYIFKFAYS